MAFVCFFLSFVHLPFEAAVFSFYCSQHRSIINLSVLFYRNNSIACLRAKAQEHQARLINSGLLLQVRSLAGLQNSMNHSPQSTDSNTINSSSSPLENSSTASGLDQNHRAYHHHHHHHPLHLSPTAANSGSIKSEHNLSIAF